MSQWRYVSSKMNPADDASRGMNVDALLTGSSWVEGPNFLWKSEGPWPECVMETAVSLDDPEVKGGFIVSAVIATDQCY